MDANLTWKYHINKTLSNPIFYINIFLNTSSIFCTETLYHSMVHGHLTYGIQVWSGCTSVHKLMKLPKRRFGLFTIIILDKISPRQNNQTNPDKQTIVINP